MCLLAIRHGCEGSWAKLQCGFALIKICCFTQFLMFGISYGALFLTNSRTINNKHFGRKVREMEERCRSKQSIYPCWLLNVHCS